MSESEEKDDPPKHFSAFAYETHHDPGTLSLSESDPELSDDAEVASLTPEEEEDDEEDSKQDGLQKSFDLPFTLKGTDASFSQRSLGIFGGLQDLQKSSPLAHRNVKQKRKIVASSLQEVARENSGSAEKSSAEKEAAPLSTGRAGSTSAKPSAPSGRPSAPSGRVPDYLEHPERWTKYSLEDVPDSSDRTNRSTALAFMTELQQRKEGKEAKEVPKKTSSLSFNQDSSSSGEGRILFTRPNKEGQGSKDKSGLHFGQLHLSGSWGDEGKEEGDVVGEQAKAEALGFHGFKKRPRKNIRPKADKVDEEEDTP
ncbi:U5 small nuclear ribonucleoprotein TSSC4 [Mixophyes fleayi]|uniref:U5 small nuclear ribonucleoprotein TSSC4 n=1 Tax=Mixophyes fleayi TaxID=3061075 RepID=UPI003F4DF8B7